jgi:hypothetical protein
MRVQHDFVQLPRSLAVPATNPRTRETNQYARPTPWFSDLNELNMTSEGNGIAVVFMMPSL